MDEKMKQIKNREYRSFSNFELRQERGLSNEDEDCVCGVPVVFNTPTCLYEYEGVKFYEVIDRHAFDHCDMSDVIFNYNHSGRIAARTRNKTLELSLNDSVMEMRAFLGGTSFGKGLLEDIRGGYIDRMSFQFDIDEGGIEYDPKTHTRTITRIKKLYDVSAVDIPAYDQTSISARRFFESEIQKEIQSIDHEKKRKKLIVISKL